MRKDPLFTKYKITKKEVQVLERFFKIPLSELEQTLDEMSEVERNNLFYKVNRTILEIYKKMNI
ncbi:hypothetical protein IJD34_07930 [bacterium]|nr:hypothetical protein [bacterium]